MHLGVHVLSRYEHLRKAFVTIEQLRWTRIIPVDGEQGVAEHAHAFYRDGDEKRVVKIEVSIEVTVTLVAGYDDEVTHVHFLNRFGLVWTLLPF